MKRVIINFVTGLLLLVVANVSWARDPQKYAAIIMDMNGRILHQEKAHNARYPASLTKMMTLYEAFKAVHSGRWTFGTTLAVSKKAASMPRTNVELRAGDRITVRDAILAVIVHSANDAAMVLAESLSGSEAGFARQMNLTSKKLAMHNTNFCNPSGLPNPKQKTTAYDMAILGVALKKHFPQYYHLFSVQHVKIKNRQYNSHNRFVQNHSWADGIKTGFIRASGFNITVSANLGGQNLVGVLMGGRTAKERDQQLASLFKKYYAKTQLSYNK